MNKLIGTNKSLNEQLIIFEKILSTNNDLMIVLERLSKSNLKNYYVGAGAINQTVFNYYHGFDSNYGIKDYDIVYFDKDLSYEKEDIIIKNISQLLSDINIDFDIKNEARVHLWHKEKYGSDIEPYTSVEDAISKWFTTVTCIGVRLEDNNLIVFAPYGLNDLFNLLIRPIKQNSLLKKNYYDDKVNNWKNRWPLLKTIEWNETDI